MDDSTPRSSTSEITFAILSYGFAELTIRCIDSIRKFEPNSSIIVLDNHSPDDSFAQLTAKYATDPQIRLIASERNLGVALGRNNIAKQISTDYIAFIDNDAFLTGPASFDSLKYLAVQTTVAYGYPLMLDDKLNCYFYNIENKPVDAIGGAFLVVKTAIFRQFGGFDETYGVFGHEDVEFGLRLKSKGFVLIGNINIPVIHEDHHSSSLLDNKSQLEDNTQQLLLSQWGTHQNLLEINRQHIDFLSCTKCEETWSRSK